MKFITRKLPAYVDCLYLFVGREGIAVGIDIDGNVHQLEMDSNRPTGRIWKLLDAMPANRFTDVSCGMYACWFVTMKGGLYISRDIDAAYTGGTTNRLVVRKVPAPTAMKQVASGFSSTLWAISISGEVYTRSGVNILHPEGTKWEKKSSLLFTKITAGLMGVYGFTNNGLIVTLESKFLHIIFYLHCSYADCIERIVGHIRLCVL